MKRWICLLSFFSVLLLTSCNGETELMRIGEKNADGPLTYSVITEDGTDAVETERTRDFLGEAQGMEKAEDWNTLYELYFARTGDERIAAAAATLHFAETESAEHPVYWTGGGAVYHTSKNCSALARTKSLTEGTVAEAKQAGKTQPCKRCALGE